MLLLVAGAVGAEDPGLEELRARLDRVEKQNEYLRKVVETGPAPVAADRPGEAKEVEPKSREAEPQGHKVGSNLNLKSSWKDGLYSETTQQDFKVRVGGRIHQDWVAFDQDEALTRDSSFGPLNDGVFFRRARLRVEGTAYEVFDWVAEFEFNTTTEVLPRNVWAQITNLPWVGQVRAGHFREPFSLERMTSGRDITFLERSAVDDAFVPAFSPGVMLWNAPCDERLTWAVGFFRNTPDPDNGIDFGDGEYAVTGRATCLPWYVGEGRGLLHLGAAYSHRNAEQDRTVGEDVFRFRSRPRFRAAASLPRFVDTGLIAGESTELFGAEAALVVGRFSVQAEYMRAVVTDAVFPAAGGTLRGNAAFQGYYVLASWFLTGEHRPYDRRAGAFSRVRPFEPFFFVRTPEGEASQFALGTGAWEIAVQYSWLDLNDSGIRGGVLEDVTLGMNWYLNPNFKVQWNYTAAHRELRDPLKNGTAHALAMRLGIDF